MRKQKREILLSEINKLSTSQKKCILLYFGFATGTPMSMEDVARILGVTRMNVSLVISKGIESLKEAISKNVMFKEEKSEPREVRKRTYKK